MREDRDRRRADDQQEHEEVVEDLELEDRNEAEAVKGGFNPVSDSAPRPGVGSNHSERILPG